MGHPESSRLSRDFLAQRLPAVPGPSQADPSGCSSHDYWFLKKNIQKNKSGDPLKTAALIAIMDYYDGEYKLKRFRALCKESYEVDDGSQ